MSKGLGNIMKQAQMMQQKMARMQQELESRQVEASAGGGMVVAVVNGKQQLVSLKIEKNVVDPEDVEMLQDLVTAAVNEAIKKSQELVQEERAKVPGGLNIPGLFCWPSWPCRPRAWRHGCRKRVFAHRKGASFRLFSWKSVGSTGKGTVKNFDLVKKIKRHFK